MFKNPEDEGCFANIPPRRRAVTERGGKKFRNALDELRELKKSGKKRVDEYEVQEEDNVYDEVNEDEYARIVQKRREEGGGFVVGHDGLGYTDIGEEIEWVNEDARQEEDKSKGAKKKKKDGKKRQGEEPVPGAKDGCRKCFKLQL
eukprot:jgi/Picre1/32159/NNA_007505.t1